MAVLITSGSKQVRYASQYGDPAQVHGSELDDPELKAALQVSGFGWQSSSRRDGTDPLVMTRPDSTVLINTSLANARAGHLSLIQRRIKAHAKLYVIFGT